MSKKIVAKVTCYKQNQKWVDPTLTETTVYGDYFIKVVLWLEYPK